MDAIFVSRGDSIDYTPSADVAAGDVVAQGPMIGIAKVPIPANTLGALAVEGVFDVVKASGAIAAGALVYWDAGDGEATGTSTDNTLMGKAVLAAGANDPTVRVKLTP